MASSTSSISPDPNQLALRKKSIIDQTARGGEYFVSELYYRVYDTLRSDLHHFYEEPSVLIWNGTPYQGLGTIRQFYSHLPPSKHEIHSIDCHPIIENLETAMNILVTVVGRVSYDSRSAGAFHQTFILARRPDGKYYVAQDIMRLVEST
eukprot:CAMPEP_0177673128 /NCGR_PEP_ID=MMETSP0447-20121125/25756_1 /TAXON_ID=0 /ORGANISM="Stygamoeba regulata, Strain BSH-02190019" /LENGTH=149 /DNA_ID=CAMNT_0019180935 /DNA_START=174 /DNA_END=623 /DNA_ORIENTATION=+